MAVNPLDLQTSFMQIGNVSKKEILSKEQEILRQDNAAEHIKKETSKNINDVPAATKLNESVKVKDSTKKDEKQQPHSHSPKKENGEDSGDNEDEADSKKNVIKRDDVGTKLDIVG